MILNTQFKLPALFIFVLISFISHSQQTYSIHGSVVDSTQTKIESGNIIILSPADSTVIKGTHFWDGQFELHGISEREVIIKVTSSGYTPLFIDRTFSSDSSDFNLGTLSIKPLVNELKSVNVVYRKPMFERELGKLVVNVDGTILSEKGTVLELLRSAPNVIVKASGSIEVVGKGAAIIYLDGRRLNSLEILDALSANDIDRIEVIETPSARYDAEGNAVIEIITKNGAMNGYEINVGLRGMFRTQAQVAYWVNFSFRKDWFSLYASVGQYSGTIHEDEEYYREVYGTNPVNMDNTVEREFDHNFDSWYDLNMDFRLDTNQTIFVNYLGSRLQSNILAKNTNLLYENNLYLGALNSESNGQTNRYTHSIASGYSIILDTMDSDFRITGQYTRFSSNIENEIEQISNFGSSIQQFFQSHSFNGINVLSGQAEFTKNFSKNLQLSTGAKYSSVSNASGIDFKERSNDNWVTDSTLFNEFDYLENILAGFVEVKGKIKKFSYHTGLRYEWTDVQGNSFISGTGVVDRDYHNLFPNVQLSYNFTDDLVLGASYNYRINRPLYQDMDPFVTFVDSLTSFKGNPQLLPSYTHNSEISLVYMEYASIKLGYSKAINPMFLTVEKDPIANTFTAITKNIESSEMYTIGLVIPWENKWWTTFNAIGYNFNNFSYLDGGQLIASEEPTYYVSLYNEFRIPKLFNIELNYEYIYPGSQGFFVAKPFHYFQASISRKFLKRRLSLNFTMFDPFKWSIERADASLGNFYVDYSSWSDNRSFMITARWNFGKLKNSSMVGETIDGEERDRIKE